MLIYHPAFDPYHAAFRILLLSTRMGMDEIETERMRVWDFYFTFPGEAKHISFPGDLIALKKVFKDTPNEYEDLVDAKRIFERMKPFQYSAMRYLAAHGLIESKELSKDKIKRTEKTIPNELVEKMNSLTVQQENIIKLVTSPFNNLPLYGNNGFKFRTKLLEFKYDAV
jgi:hypothetical protein